MKTPLPHSFRCYLAALLMLVGPANGETEGQTTENLKSIEQAKTALDDAKVALQAAQDTLSDAQKKQNAASRAKAKTSPSTKNDGRLYKWVDEYGTVFYQDSPPPKNVKVLDSDLLKDENAGKKKIKEVRRASDPAPLLDGSTPVMVYTADNCKPCQSVVLFLTQKQVPFVERDIRTDRRARERLSNLSKQISVPSLFIGERIIQGHSKPMITRALEEAGYLTSQK